MSFLEQSEPVDEWKSTMFLYKSAMKQVQTKIDILKDEFVEIHNYNPIEHVAARIKTPESIVKKLKRAGKEVSIENMRKYLNDIVGIRIICSFTSDIYMIADMISNQADVKVITIKNYIEQPKPNGYKSYHMVISIPVFVSDGPVDVKVEIQIRTIAMDFWASLEHQMRYKKQAADRPDIAAELRSCAETIAATDARMLGIRKRIEQMQETESRGAEPQGTGSQGTESQEKVL